MGDWHRDEQSCSYQAPMREQEGRMTVAGFTQEAGFERVDGRMTTVSTTPTALESGNRYEYKTPALRYVTRRRANGITGARQIYSGCDYE